MHTNRNEAICCWQERVKHSLALHLGRGREMAFPKRSVTMLVIAFCNHLDPQARLFHSLRQIFAGMYQVLSQVLSFIECFLDVKDSYEILKGLVSLEHLHL